MAWMCASPKAGMASRPARSTTSVCGVHSSATSASSPIATILAPLIAIDAAKPLGAVGLQIRPFLSTSVGVSAFTILLEVARRRHGDSADLARTAPSR